MSAPNTGGKPASLIGRLAVQLKLISMDQLAEATAEQGRHDNKRIGEIFVEKGFITPVQLEKLKKVQQDVIAKHRAKQASTGRTVPARGVGAAPVAPSSAPPVEARGASPETPPVVRATDPVASSPRVSAPANDDPRPRSAPRGNARVEVESDDALGLQLVESVSDDRARIHQVLRDAVAAGASDIHLHSGAALQVRINGHMTEVGTETAGIDEIERMVAAILSPSERQRLLREGELDFCYAVDGVGRFRANVYRQQRGFDAVLRSIPAEPPDLESLGLPSTLAKFTNYHQGMVLITGPAGCGKSSTMAALVNLINEEREEHILTVEDPIEYVHPSKRCLVNQRHAGAHTASFARALRGALREDPDVIVIGELRDLETISLAMTAAETGHFVLATLHTSNAIRTINRMIGAFPSNRQDQVRTMLSDSLRAVISQRLVETADESGRIPALEILVINKAISNLVREQKTVQIRSAIQTGAAHGMMLLEQSLNTLVQQGRITRTEALRHAEEAKLITG